MRLPASKILRKAPATEPPSFEDGGVAAVNRAFSILRTFSKQEPSLTLAQISAKTGLYKSTILRLAESLESFGYLSRSSTGAFSIGPAPVRLAAIFKTGLHPAEIVMPLLRDLSQETSESAALYVRAGNARLCAYRVQSPRAISDNVQQGDVLPLDRGAGGHVLLAFSDAEGARYEKIREQKMCVTLGDRDRETAAVACPVFGVGQRLEGALSLSGPIHRFTQAAVKRMSASLRDTSRRLTAALGGDDTIFDESKGRKRTAATK